MIGVFIALLLFLGLIVLLLWGAYTEIGRDLPCKRRKRQSTTPPAPDHPNDDAGTRKAA
jgi:hypothetical protein